MLNHMYFDDKRVDEGCESLEHLEPRSQWKGVKRTFAAGAHGFENQAYGVRKRFCFNNCLVVAFGLVRRDVQVVRGDDLKGEIGEHLDLSPMLAMLTVAYWRAIRSVGVTQVEDYLRQFGRAQSSG